MIPISAAFALLPLTCRLVTEAASMPPPRIVLAGDVERTAASIAESMKAMGADFRLVLEDPSGKIGRVYFDEASSASGKLVQGGRPVPAEVNRFHNNVDEFLKGLEQLEKGARPDLGGKAPDPKEVRMPVPKRAKDFREFLHAVKDVANEQEGLREIRRVKLKDGTTAQEAVQYADLVLDRVDLVLHGRGMFRLEEQEKRQVDEAMSAPLAAVRKSIHDLVDESGKPRADQIASVKKALTEAEKATDALDSKSGDGRDRKNVVRESLGLIRGNLALPKALKT